MANFANEALIGHMRVSIYSVEVLGKEWTSTNRNDGDFQFTAEK